MHSIETINRIIALLFAICYFYQYIYVLVPYFKKYRIVPKNSGNAGKATIADADLNRKQNRFAAVICARNEEKTLENLISYLSTLKRIIRMPLMPFSSSMPIILWMSSTQRR